MWVYIWFLRVYNATQRTLKIASWEVKMSHLQMSFDPEEMRYARHVAVNGKDQSVHGNNIYAVARVKLLAGIPGMVTVGCIVETEKKRETQGKDQDFGLIKIMFYVLFEKHQIDLIKEKFPEEKYKYFDRDNKEAIILTWNEYKEAINLR